jgi:peptide/nickel transport system substrate-binding protein
MYIGQWGMDYWDANTNTDFVRNPDNSDTAKVKPLAWRNAWEAPALSMQADAAVLERDPAKRKAIYEKMQAEFRATSPFIMIYQQTEVAAYRVNVTGFRIGPTSDTNYVYRAAKR